MISAVVATSLVVFFLFGYSIGAKRTRRVALAETANLMLHLIEVLHNKGGLNDTHYHDIKLEVEKSIPVMYEAAGERMP